MNVIIIMLIIAISFTVCLLNLHEDERNKLENWVPVGWLPVYNDSRDKHPGIGYEATSARKLRLYHHCWTGFLSGWAVRTEDAVITNYSILRGCCNY
jgi:hypothetical protein